MAYFSASLLLLSASFAASCANEPSRVSRDLRGVWSPEGDSLLIVTSRYSTARPSEPYFAAASARDFEIVLSLASGPAADPLASRAELDAFPEAGLPGLAQGGLPQYAPAYWFPEADSGRGLALFGGRDPYARLVGPGLTRRYAKPEAALGAVYGEHPRLGDFGGLAALVAECEPFDAVPSPDGSILAVLYFRSALPFGSFGPMDTARALVFFEAASGALVRVRSGWVDEADPWRRSLNLEPYLPLESDADSFTSLAWEPGGGAVLLYLGSSEDGRAEEPTAEGWPQLAPRVLRIPLDAAAPVAAATELPRRPLPTSSGPVSPSGLAVALELGAGNATRLLLRAFPPGGAAVPGEPDYPAWAPFPSGETLPAAEWGGGAASGFGFF